MNFAGFKIQTTVIIRLSPRGGGGGLFKTRPSRKGVYLRGGLIQKSGKYVAKGPNKRLKVLKNELDKMAIKLNYMKVDIGVIMQKNILKNFNQWLFFLTESSRILERGLFKNSPSKRGLISREA